MPIDWTQPLQTRHDKPRKAEVLEGRGPSGQRRVLVKGDFAASLPPADKRSEWWTVFLYREDGNCRGDGAPGPMDLVNVADTLAKAA